MNPLSKDILKKIKKDHIAPRPRWQFLFLHFFLWTTLVASIIFGSLAFGIILRAFGSTDWEIARRVGDGHLKGFILALPYLWFLLLGFTLLASYALFTHTKKVYRYHPAVVGLISVLISLAIGGGLYASGGANAIERELVENVGPYSDWHETRERIWLAPERGVLVGRVTEIESNEAFSLEDFRKQIWKVITEDEDFEEDFAPEVGKPIGVMGKLIEEGWFEAERILPWKRSDFREGPFLKRNLRNRPLKAPGGMGAEGADRLRSPIHPEGPKGGPMGLPSSPLREKNERNPNR